MVLFYIMSHWLQGICLTEVVQQPVWMESTEDVREMAKIWTIYFCFSAKQFKFYTNVERSLLFLRSIPQHSLLGAVTSLQTAIHSHQQSLAPFDQSGDLPDHLRS